MKKFKLLFTTLSLILAVVLFTGCASNDLLSYVNNNQDVTIEESFTGKDGKNGVDGKDGKDGDSIDLYSVYQKLVELGEFSGSYGEFVKEYLQTEETVYSSAKALTSVVSIYSGFVNTVNYATGYFTSDTYEQKYYGAGSGVIFRLNKDTGDAIIVTNYHVVYDSDSNDLISQDISLFVYGKETIAFKDTKTSVQDIYGNTYSFKEIVSTDVIKATYLGGSLKYDIAVLKVTGSEVLKNSDVTEAHFADSNDITVGETVVAVGNPSGAGIASTEGVISVDSEILKMKGADGATDCEFRVIRTDAAVNPGNSGGGLFNAKGELIGIVNAKITSSTIENIGYAIPSNIANNIAENIIRNCDGEENTSLLRCLLGIQLKVASSSAVYNQATLKTEIIEKVAIDYLTDTSIVTGILEAGDILTGVTINYKNGESITKKITRTFHLVDLSLTLSVGDTMVIKRTASDGTAKPDASITFAEDSVNIFP